MSENVEPIRHRVEVDVPITHLWNVMTDPATVSQWLGCLNYQAKLGHTFYMQMDPAKRTASDLSGATHCDVTALEKPAHFAFSWYMPGTPKTNVSLRLTSVGPSKTRVDFVHDGWDQFPAEMIRAIRDGLQNGWGAHALPALARIAKERGAR